MGIAYSFWPNTNCWLLLNSIVLIASTERVDFSRSWFDYGRGHKKKDNCNTKRLALYQREPLLKEKISPGIGRWFSQQRVCHTAWELGLDFLPPYKSWVVLPSTCTHRHVCTHPHKTSIHSTHRHTHFLITESFKLTTNAMVSYKIA